MEKLKDWETYGHRTFWWHIKKIYNIDRPSKYCVVFNTYTDNPGSFSVTSFNTLEEALEEAKLINIIYSDTPKPERLYNVYEYNKYKKEGYKLDYSNGAYFWGYMVLDMINNKIIKIVNTIKHCGFTFDNKITLDKIDVLFRGEDEIPSDYIWDMRGEYEGWLQFRWGDKKNALDYIEPEEKKKFNNPQVILNNNEDFEGNYEGYLPCTLAEEIAVDEYIDNGGTFDKKDSTSSIADILGDDNPLIKLKEQLKNK